VVNIWKWRPAKGTSLLTHHLLLLHVLVKAIVIIINGFKIFKTNRIQILMSKIEHLFPLNLPIVNRHRIATTGAWGSVTLAESEIYWKFNYTWALMCVNNCRFCLYHQAGLSTRMITSTIIQRLRLGCEAPVIGHHHDRKSYSLVILRQCKQGLF